MISTMFWFPGVKPPLSLWRKPTTFFLVSAPSLAISRQRILALRNRRAEAMILGEGLRIPIVGFICQPDHKIEAGELR